MRRLTTLITTGLVAALAIGTLAVPASAADRGRMTVVNGIPGTRIDICVGNSNEIRSGLKYGGVFKKQLIGAKKLRFRKAAPGACKGQLLAGRTIGFPSGSDKTVVVTSKLPRVLVFRNEQLGTAADPDGALAVRHAADLAFNSVYFRWSVWNSPIIDDGAFSPSAVSAFEKGDQFTSALFSDDDVIFRVKATRADPGLVVAKGPFVEQLPNRRFEFVLVGTKGSNARVVPITTYLSQPPI